MRDLLVVAVVTTVLMTWLPRRSLHRSNSPPRAVKGTGADRRRGTSVSEQRCDYALDGPEHPLTHIVAVQGMAPMTIAQCLAALSSSPFPSAPYPATSQLVRPYTTLLEDADARR